MIAGLVCYFIGNATLWSTEHIARLQALEDRQPHISASIGTIEVGTSNGHTVLTLVVTVLNTGAPSILQLRKVIVAQPGGQQFVAKILLQPTEDLRISAREGMKPFVSLRKDYLPEKRLRSLFIGVGR